MSWPAAIEGERVRLVLDEAAEDQSVLRGHLVRLADGALAGRFELRRDAGVLIAWELCVEPAMRGYGLGSEAARLVRQQATRAGFPVLRARSHPALGLSVYFWMRMGLHPVPGEGPEGGLWFERRLD